MDKLLQHFPRYWLFVRGIHRLSVNSPHKDQWHGTLNFSLICAWINDWINNREAGDSSRHRTHYDVIVMDPAYRRHFQPQVSGCQPIMSFTNMLKYVLRCSFRSDRITYKQTKPSLILCHKNLMTRLCIIYFPFSIRGCMINISSDPIAKIFRSVYNILHQQITVYCKLLLQIFFNDITVW